MLKGEEMTPKENLKDIMDKRILKTKMYSFDEVRDMFKEERQRIREEIETREVAYMLIDGVIWLKEKQVLALLSEEEGK